MRQLLLPQTVRLWRLSVGRFAYRAITFRLWVVQQHACFWHSCPGRVVEAARNTHVKRKSASEIAWWRKIETASAVVIPRTLKVRSALSFICGSTRICSGSVLAMNVPPLSLCINCIAFNMRILAHNGSKAFDKTVLSAADIVLRWFIPYNYH